MADRAKSLVSILLTFYVGMVFSDLQKLWRSANLSALDSGVEDAEGTEDGGDAETVRRWVGDVAVWYLPGYVMPLELTLWMEKETNRKYALSKLTKKKGSVTL